MILYLSASSSMSYFGYVSRRISLKIYIQNRTHAIYRMDKDMIIIHTQKKRHTYPPKLALCVHRWVISWYNTQYNSHNIVITTNYEYFCNLYSKWPSRRYVWRYITDTVQALTKIGPSQFLSLYVRITYTIERLTKCWAIFIYFQNSYTHSQS